MRTQLVVAMIVCSVLGCGSDGPSTPADGDAFLDRYYRVQCDLAYRCEAVLGEFGLKVASETAERCPTYAERRADLFSRTLRESVANGTIRIDQDLGDECLSLETMSCEEVLASFETTFASCVNVFSGTLPEGSACVLPYECSAGLTCVDFVSACGGTCVPVILPGEACSADDAQPCGLLATCRDEVCLEQIQHVAPSLGSCGAAVREGTNLVSTECRPIERCVEGTCVPRVANGAACSQPQECLSGSRCMDGVCQAPVLVTEAGQPCGGLRLCDGLRELACIDDLCVAGADFQLGSPCGTSTLLRQCEDGRCDATTDRCEPLRALGKPCTSFVQCDGGSCEAGVCAAAICS